MGTLSLKGFPFKITNRNILFSLEQDGHLWVTVSGNVCQDLYLFPQLEHTPFLLLVLSVLAGNLWGTLCVMLYSLVIILSVLENKDVSCSGKFMCIRTFVYGDFSFVKEQGATVVYKKIL